MFNQSNYSDNYEREKLRILQTLNVQIQSMAVKLDQIVTQVEENVFKVKPCPSQFKSVILNSTDTVKPVLNNAILTPTILNASSIQLNNNHQLIKIIDQPINDAQKNKPRRPKSIQNLIKSSNSIEFKREVKPPDTTAKRNKQQRQFNTFVRESINQLLGTDFMKSHDVQDIDQQVMEMIRKEAVENYLPDNIRPRRAWHLAKASLRTLKRTLNNRK